MAEFALTVDAYKGESATITQTMILQNDLTAIESDALTEVCGNV